MAHAEDRLKSPSKPWARLLVAAWAALAIVLIGAAAFARPAPAAVTSQPAQSQAADFQVIEMDEEWDEEWEGEEESEEEEFEEEEDDEDFGTEGPLLFPSDCLLHSAEAQVTVSASHDTVGLTIHYTATTPTNVTVDYWLKGGKGSLQFKQARQHFGKRGVFRGSEHLTEHAMNKVRAARTFIVQLGIPAAPAYCSRYSTQRLAAKHTLSNRATWSRPN